MHIYCYLKIDLFIIFFIFNFLPREGHRDNVSYLDIYLFKMILSDDNVNLSYLMIYYMNEYFQSSKSYLSYGAVTTTQKVYSSGQIVIKNIKNY